MSLTARRVDRENRQPRPVTIETHVAPYAEGSALIATGETRVWCTASIEDRLPPWLENSSQGWVTAEYSMLPRSTHTRINRNRASGSGRSQEISRLIGRSLRAGIDLKRIGSRTITVDCDVLQADGGTRTAAITGGFVALQLALDMLTRTGTIPRSPVTSRVAAISVGLVAGEIRLDLDYTEDSNADVDFNVVMDSRGNFIEIQGSAEGQTFNRGQLDAMVDLAETGISELLQAQQAALAADRDD
ncbi:MAG: ribonuclease PH [Chloroflexota bacterium]